MSVCDIPVVATVCDATGDGAATLVAAPLDWLGQAIGQAAAWLFTTMWSVFDTTTLVDVTGGAYVAVYNILFGVAVFLMLIFFCLQLLTGLVQRDPRALLRAGTGLAKSILGSFLAISLTAILLEITDQLAIGVVQATGNTMSDIGDRIAVLAAGLTTINITSPGAGAIVTIFLAGLAISAAAIVWFSLLTRKALLLVAIVFAPIAMAGFSWDVARGWFGKWAAFVVALTVSKLVLVVVFLVAVAQVSAPIEADLASVSDPIAGVVLMFVAAFAPYLTYKFVAFVGFDMYHAMSSEQEAKSALNRPIPVPAPPPFNQIRRVLPSNAATTRGPGGHGAPPTTPVGPPASGAVEGKAAASGSAGAAASGGAASAGAAAGLIGAAALVGTQVVAASAAAGPRLGEAVGSAAADQSDQAGFPAAPPATHAPSTRSAVPPSRPRPIAPPARSTPAKPRLNTDERN